MVPVFVIGYHPESNRQFPQGQKTMGVNSFGEEGRNLHDCCWNDQQAEKDGCHGNNHARPGIFYLIKLNTSPLLNLSYHLLYFGIVKAFLNGLYMYSNSYPVRIWFTVIYLKKFLDIKFVTQVAQFLMKFMHIGIKPTNFQSQGIMKQSLLWI